MGVDVFDDAAKDLALGPHHQHGDAADRHRAQRRQEPHLKMRQKIRHLSESQPERSDGRQHLTSAVNALRKPAISVSCVGLCIIIAWFSLASGMAKSLTDSRCGVMVNGPKANSTS